MNGTPQRANLGRRNRSRWRSDRGAYTAELAVALPALLLLVAWGMLGIGYAQASLKCDDASRAAARAAARGEPTAAVEAAGRQAAPRDARLVVARAAGMVEVRCAAAVRVAGLRTFQVQARAVAAVEDLDPVQPPPTEPGR
ncbi:MAG: pilus assembly protein TadE [Streptosporangiales bacterium]|nr:pilus assembly protein TadE [Streptosporangiales bacterium]